MASTTTGKEPSAPALDRPTTGDELIGRYIAFDHPGDMPDQAAVGDAISMARIMVVLWK